MQGLSGRPLPRGFRSTGEASRASPTPSPTAGSKPGGPSPITPRAAAPPFNQNTGRPFSSSLATVPSLSYLSTTLRT